MRTGKKYKRSDKRSRTLKSMNIAIHPMMMSDLDYTLNTTEGPETMDLEIDTNTVYWHLTDHNYIHTKPRKHPKKHRKQIKITELKAIYNCTACGYRTMNRDVLNNHICTKDLQYILPRNITRKLPKGYKKCTKCNFPAEKSNFTNHMKQHIEVQKKCMNHPTPKINSDTNMYECSKCKYTTQNPTGLKIHMHIHSRGTPYKCTECNFFGVDLKDLIKHYDQVKDLHCNCGYATHVKSQMTAHIRCHTGEKPYICAICDFATSDRAGLHRHIYKKHIVE